LTQDELVIGKDLTLTGSGADSTIIQAADVLGGVTYRVLHITSGPDGPSPVVAISGVTIRHGRKSGIYNYRGILTLLGVVVTANEHNGYGRGIANEGSLTFINSSVIGNRNTHQGGGISNYRGTMSIANSVVSGNTTNGEQASVGGGIYHFEGTITVDNSTVSGSIAALHGGGIKNDRGTVTLTNSTVSDNTADSSGGSSSGGGIRNDGGSVGLINSTVSGNTVGQMSVGQGGGLYHMDGTITLINSTVSANSADRGGGIFNSRPDEVSLVNTIIAGNSAPSNPDCYGALNSLGHNLTSTNSGCIVPASAGDLFGFDPTLGPLQDNGGPTLTHALLPGSPAIDATDDGQTPNTDQRGVARPQGIVGDIGAFELGPTP
jgi:hypothetical protein